MIQRYPIYAEADVTVLSENVRKDVMVNEVLSAVANLPGESELPSEGELQ
jgi:shikimate kinase